MRKVFVLLSLLAIILPLSAGTTATLATDFGGTTKDNSVILGLKASVSAVKDYHRVFGLGVALHGTADFMVNDKPDESFTAFIAALHLEYRPVNSVQLSLGAGPAVVFEGISTGLGIGIDLGCTYYFYKDLGMTLGLALYPQFYVDDWRRGVDDSLAGSAYFGFTWRRNPYSRRQG